MSYLSRERVAGAMSVTRKKGEGTEGEEGEIDVPRTSQQHHWILRDRHWTRASPMQKAASSTKSQRSNNSGDVISGTGGVER
jgi:hypothetical protein